MSIKELLLKIRTKIKKNAFLSTLLNVGACVILISSGLILVASNLLIAVILIILGSIVIVDIVYKFECEE